MKFTTRIPSYLGLALAVLWKYIKYRHVFSALYGSPCHTILVEVCQHLTWRAKNITYSIYILHNTINVVALRSVYQVLACSVKWICLKDKNVSYVKNNSAISLKLMPWCSPSSPPSYEPNFMFLAPLLAELAYLAMLFILQQTHTKSSVYQLKNE